VEMQIQATCGRHNGHTKHSTLISQPKVLTRNRLSTVSPETYAIQQLTAPIR